MNYKFNNNNLLIIPEKYMYTKFEGISFIESYLSNRNYFLEKFRFGKNNLSDNSKLACETYFFLKKYINLSNLSINEEYLLKSAKKNKPEKRQKRINDFSIKKSANTLELLYALFASILLDFENSSNKVFLDYLVQRFEVSKKIYEIYLPGFRKGQGEYQSLELYWIFSLILSMYYAKTKQIKYLSTLIKVSDLITSQPIKKLEDDVPKLILEILITSEIHFVKSMLQLKSIKI